MCMFSGALSLALPFSHACIHCDYCDRDRPQNYRFFHEQLKLPRRTFVFLVISLYIYKRTRQLAEEQQVVVKCGRAGVGAVS